MVHDQDRGDDKNVTNVRACINLTSMINLTNFATFVVKIQGSIAIVIGY